MTTQSKTQAQDLVEKRKFNRQVNFFVMRHMWQVIRGRNANDTIYMALGIKRNRYTRVIDTGVIRLSHEELISLRQTGIPEGIFTGERQFNCIYEATQSANEEQESTKKRKRITENEWRAFFEYRKKRKAEKSERQLKHSEQASDSSKETPNESNDKEKTAQDIIYELLNKIEKKNPENNSFFRLCYYLEFQAPAPDQKPEDTLHEIEKVVSKLSFTFLNNFDTTTLERLEKLLIDRYKLVGGIIVYKKDNAIAEKAKRQRALLKK